MQTSTQHSHTYVNELLWVWQVLCRTSTEEGLAAVVACLEQQLLDVPTGPVQGEIV